MVKPVPHAAQASGVPSGAPSGSDSGLPAWASRALAEDALLYGVVAMFGVATVLVALVEGYALGPLFASHLELAVQVAMVVAAAVLAQSGIAVLRERPARPLAALGGRLVAAARAPGNRRLLLSAVTLLVFMSSYMFHKTRIPLLNPFGWDVAFAEMDRLLFLGEDPWRVLHPLLGYPAITLVIDYLYSAWVPLVVIVWVAMNASRVPDALRRQYMLSTVFTWLVLGLVMATIFASAGPCYFDRVVPGEPSPFVPLEAYLAGVSELSPLSSSMFKQFLWSIHAGEIAELGGISAMPSMHNAQAALFAAAAYRLDRRLGHVATAYMVVIFLGSIHLGWHYAVDGVFGIAGALAIWWLVGRALGRPSFTQS